MTTTNVVLDSRANVTAPDGSVHLVGSYFKKYATGGNGLTDEEHPYTVTYLKQYNTLMHLWRSSFGYYYGIMRPTILPAEYHPNALINCVNRMGEKVRGHQFNAAVNLGEAKESIRMIGDVARVLARAGIQLKRGRVVQCLQTLGISPTKSRVGAVQKDLRENLATAWLGLNYGVMPLLGAIDDAMEALASNLRPRSVTFKDRYSGPKTYAVDPCGVAGGVVTGYGSKSCRLKWVIKESEQFSTAEEFGFHAPSLAAWELAGFSYVADWFLPIGSWLEARSVLSAVEGTFVSSEREKYSILFEGSNQWFCYPHHWIVSGQFQEDYLRLDRTVGIISQMPLPRPELKNPFSTSHVLSGIALLQVVFGGR